MKCFPFIYHDQPDLSSALSCSYTPCEVADPIGSIPMLTTPSTGLTLTAADRLRNQK